MDKTIEYAKSSFNGLCFVNLVDFDALYGHRRDVIGYKAAIERFDEKLGILLSQIDDDTLVMVTADHGNDPTHTGTDHTREDVPLICYYNGINGGVMPTMESFTVISSTILENFGLDKISKYPGFLNLLEDKDV